MADFKVEQIRIGDKTIDRIIDEKGTKWYPFKQFLTKILCKYDKLSSFRDSSMSIYMKIFDYFSEQDGSKRQIRTWFMRESGIIKILENMNVEKKTRNSMYESRKKGLYEACLFFGVKKDLELNPTFIQERPDLKDYNLWAFLCIENDRYLKQFDTWKECSKCGFYYPFKQRYFGKQLNKGAYCLQCQGKDFKCQNKLLQALYENDCFEVIYKLWKNKPSEDIVKELKNEINKRNLVKWN